VLLVISWLCLTGAFGVPGAQAITYGPDTKGLGSEQTVFDHENEATGDLIEACDTWDIPDQPARAFRDDQNRVQLQFGANMPRRNIGSDLNVASSFGHHDCTFTSVDGNDPDPSHYDMYSWVAAPYTFDGHTVYSLIHEEFRGWEARSPFTCTYTGGDTTQCWYNAITLETSTNSGDRFTHTDAPTHLVATVPYQWVNRTGPYGVFSPSNIIRRQPDDGYLYVIVRAKEPGTPDVSCVMRTQATALALGNPTSWRAWGDGPDSDSADSYEVQFVNPYTYTFTSTDTPAKHMCKDIGVVNGVRTVSGLSESLTYNTYFGKYILVGAYGGSSPGFYYSLSDDLIHWSQNKLLVGLETQHSWVPCDPDDPARDPSLLDPSSASRNFETTGRQLYVYYKIFRLNGGCIPGGPNGSNRDLLRLPIELQGGPANVPPTASFSVSSSTASTNQPVAFDGSASTDTDGTITRITNYRWDLDGDGAFETDTGTTATTSRSYAAPGGVNVTLRVTDSDGATSDASRTVTINATGPGASPKAPDTKASCKTLRKKRAALTRKLRTARRKLGRSHTATAKQRYRKQIKSLKKRLKRLRRTPCRR
jgi:PKD domain-containing protein